MQQGKHSMRILVFSPLYPPHIGGLESHAEHWNIHISKRGYEIMVFTPHIFKDTAVPYEESHGGHISIFRFPAFEVVSNYPLPKIWDWKFWRMYRKLMLVKHDLVVSRTRFFITSCMAYTFAKNNHVPWLHIEHGSDFVQLKNPILSTVARMYDLTIGTFVLKKADKVVANSQASADFIKKLSIQKNIDVIYRGVDKKTIESIRPSEEVRLGYPQKIIITYVGRLIDGKCVDNLLIAYAKVNSQTSDVKCHIVIIGDGPQRKNLERLSEKHNIRDAVSFLGELSFERTIAILKSSDIFVNPSLTEGLPTSVIEAALCKCAIIATDVGGTKEIVENDIHARLIAPHNIQDLSRHLIDLIKNDEKRLVLGKHAYDHVRSKFDWDSCAEQYTSIINKLSLNHEANRSYHH